MPTFPDGAGNDLGLNSIAAAAPRRSIPMQ
jgi:hypothetical protein